MKNYNKTFLGSLLAFFIGTSCCWLSSLAIWVGGAAFLGALSAVIEETKLLLISIGLVLFLTSAYLFLVRKRYTKS